MESRFQFSIENYLPYFQYYIISVSEITLRLIFIHILYMQGIKTLTIQNFAGPQKT
jgi:hypothetical protein